MDTQKKIERKLRRFPQQRDAIINRAFNKDLRLSSSELQQLKELEQKHGEQVDRLNEFLHERDGKPSDKWTHRFY